MSELSFSSKRLARMVGLFVLSLLLPVICGLLHNTRIDQMIVWCFICGICAVCFGLYTEYERLHEGTGLDPGNDYSVLSFIYLTGMAGACVAAFFPAYTAPVLAIGILCNGTFPNRMGAAMAVYFALLSSVFCGAGAYTGAAYVTLAVISIFLAELALHRELRVWVGMLIVSMSVVVPACCCYLDTHTLQPQIFMITLPCSVLTLVVVHILPKLRERFVSSEEISLDTIMDRQYHLQRMIENYSAVDYDHALRVSRVAAKVAKELGADEKLALAGGFYYRIGKLEGEPFIENGVRIAQQNCFPDRLVRILEEYNGINRPPGTLESAIVQISDMIVTKFDLLDKDTFSAGWNRDIVIYQSMNEKSSEGLYDQCGLSMNQFLKIRELLVKEEMLL